jgi:cation transporter-like permease
MVAPNGPAKTIISNETAELSTGVHLGNLNSQRTKHQLWTTTQGPLVVEHNIQKHR